MTNKEVVVSFFEKVYNEHVAEYILECYSDNYTEHHEGGARCSADAVRIVKGAYKIFPDISVEVSDIIEEDGLIATRLQFSGTQMGEFAGVPATGKTVKFEAMEFFKIEGGVITESWGAWPTHAILKQLETNK